MTDEKLAVFKAKLKELRITINDQYIDDRCLREERPTEEFESAALIANQTIVTNLLRRKGLYLKQIDFALKKVETGDYGYCNDCEEDISEKRLEVRLTAEFCIRCKEKREKYQKEVNRTGINDWDKDTD